MAIIDKNQATQLAQQYVKNLDNYEAVGGLAILEGYTLEKPYGWVFFYNTRTFAETHDAAQALTGNAPFLVEREGGGVHVLGTDQPLEDYLGEYERQMPVAAPLLQSFDIVEMPIPSNQALLTSATVPLKRSQQGIIAGITVVLLIVTSALLFSVYHQAQVVSAHIVATVTTVALMSQQQAQDKQSTAATATALTTASHAPYHADAPGDCDTGKARWKTVDGTTTSCVSGTLQMSPTSTQYVGEVAFYWNNFLDFPPNNSVEVTVRPVSDCGGIELRQLAHNVTGGYAFYLCSDNGYWDVLRYNSATGNPTVLSDGYVAAQPSYAVKAVANGAVETLVINGKTVTKVTDTMFLTTDHISLAVGETGKSGPVSFSNFTFTPLP